MCASEGMGLAPWGALGGGSFKTTEQREKMKGEGRQMLPPPHYAAVTDALEKVGKAHGTALTSVALAYVMHKVPYVFPIVGGRKIDHLKGNIEALSLQLSEEDIQTIESANPFDVGFPMNFLGGTGKPSDVWLMDMSGHFDYVEGSKPIPAPQHLGTKKSNPFSS